MVLFRYIENGQTILLLNLPGLLYTFLDIIVAESLATHRHVTAAYNMHETL